MLDVIKDMSLVKRIMFGIILGGILGILVPQWSLISVLGTMFVSCLKAIAPILVFVLIMSSIAQHQTGTPTFIKPILLLYLFATVLAAVVAVLVSYVFPITITLHQAEVTQEAPQALGGVLSVMLDNITQNPLQAIIEGNYLGVLFWSALIGLALRTRSQEIKNVIGELSVAITQVVRLIIAFAPIGILGLVFSSVATTGISGLSEYGQLLLVLVGTMLFTALVVYPLIVMLCIKENPYPLLFFCLKESAVPAFFTRSSAANIPINMMLAKKLKLNKDSYSISIPLGATINMGGAAITISIMTLTAVHTLGIEAPLLLRIILCLLAALSACGASGVAGGSLLLIPLACSLFNIPNEVAMQIVGVGFIIGVVQDSMETALNSSSDLLFTATAEFATLKKKGQELDLNARLHEIGTKAV